MKYYDKLLVAIPLALVVGIVSSVLPMIALHQGMAGGSVVAILLILDLLFRNPPTVSFPGTASAKNVYVPMWS